MMLNEMYNKPEIFMAIKELISSIAKSWFQLFYSHSPSECA